MARTHSIAARRSTSAPAATVWELLTDVSTWPEWGPFDHGVLDHAGSRHPYGTGAIRRTAQGRVTTLEKVVAFEPERHFAYPRRFARRPRRRGWLHRKALLTWEDAWCQDTHHPGEGLTLRVKASSTHARFDVTADGRGMTGRTGTALLAEVADTIGLTSSLERTVNGCRSWTDHAPGKVVRDLLVMLADGGDALRHLKVLGGDDQQVLFGSVASAATANRTIVALADDEVVVERLAAARKHARVRAWRLGGAPPVVAAARSGRVPDDPLCMDLDATLITAHSDDKDGAAVTRKKGWGFHPLLAYLDRGDGLGESLGGMLRPGNAGANTVDDHIDVFEHALDQLGALPEAVRLVVRADTAGCTHDFLAYLRAAEVGFSVGYAIGEAVRTAIRAVDDDAWLPALTQAGEVRDGAAVVEITDQLDLTPWPSGARVIVRREPLHPGAQQTLDDIDGYRFTAFLTDQPDSDITLLEQRHRAHARVEDRIRGAKDTGARNLPCDTFARNAVWLQLVLAAQDVMTFLQVLTLSGHLRRAEPATLRYQLLHVPARLVRSGRTWTLRIQHDWPWAAELLTAFDRLRSLPQPAT